MYPAGEYLISNYDGVLMIRNTEQAKTEFTPSQACESSTVSRDTRLVFDHMGGYYFLRQIWVAGNYRGREVPRSHTEVQLAQKHEQVESVIVAANVSR
jgi:hypothetical protein